MKKLIFHVFVSHACENDCRRWINDQWWYSSVFYVLLFPLPGIVWRVLCVRRHVGTGVGAVHNGWQQPNATLWTKHHRLLFRQWYGRIVHRCWRMLHNNSNHPLMLSPHWLETSTILHEPKCCESHWRVDNATPMVIYGHQSSCLSWVAFIQMYISPLWFDSARFGFSLAELLLDIYVAKSNEAEIQEIHCFDTILRMNNLFWKTLSLSVAPSFCCYICVVGDLVHECGHWNSNAPGTIIKTTEWGILFNQNPRKISPSRNPESEGWKVSALVISEGVPVEQNT